MHTPAELREVREAIALDFGKLENNLYPPLRRELSALLAWFTEQTASFEDLNNMIVGFQSACIRNNVPARNLHLQQFEYHARAAASEAIKSAAETARKQHAEIMAHYSSQRDAFILTLTPETV